MGNGRRFSRRRRSEGLSPSELSELGLPDVGYEWVDPDGTPVGEVMSVQVQNLARDALELGVTEHEMRNHMAELCESGWVRFWPEPVCRSSEELAESLPELVVVLIPHKVGATR